MREKSELVAEAQDRLSASTAAVEAAKAEADALAKEARRLRDLLSEKCREEEGSPQYSIQYDHFTTQHQLYFAEPFGAAVSVADKHVAVSANRESSGHILAGTAQEHTDLRIKMFKMNFVQKEIVDIAHNLATWIREANNIASQLTEEFREAKDERISAGHELPAENVCTSAKKYTVLSDSADAQTILMAEKFDRARRECDKLPFNLRSERETAGGLRESPLQAMAGARHDSAECAVLRTRLEDEKITAALLRNQSAATADELRVTKSVLAQSFADVRSLKDRISDLAHQLESESQKRIEQESFLAEAGEALRAALVPVPDNCNESKISFRSVPTRPSAKGSTSLHDSTDNITKSASATRLQSEDGGRAETRSHTISGVKAGGIEHRGSLAQNFQKDDAVLDKQLTGLRAARDWLKGALAEELYKAREAAAASAAQAREEVLCAALEELERVLAAKAEAQHELESAVGAGKLLELVLTSLEMAVGGIEKALALLTKETGKESKIRVAAMASIAAGLQYSLNPDKKVHIGVEINHQRRHFVQKKADAAASRVQDSAALEYSPRLERRVGSLDDLESTPVLDAGSPDTCISESAPKAAAGIDLATAAGKQKGPVSQARRPQQQHQSMGNAQDAPQTERREPPTQISTVSVSQVNSFAAAAFAAGFGPSAAGGVGMRISNSRPFRVVAVVAGGPADRAGVIPGLEILAVAGRDISSASIAEVRALIVGPVGTDVVVELAVPPAQLSDAAGSPKKPVSARVMSAGNVPGDALRPMRSVVLTRVTVGRG